MFKKQFSHVVELILESRSRAYRAVNTELIELYWQIGKYLDKQVESKQWGDGVIEQLAEYIKLRHPDLRGFTKSNLFRMRQFYNTYKNHEIVASLTRQISWTANVLVMGRAKSIEEKEFYIRLAIREKLSVRELERQINTLTFERVILSSRDVHISKGTEKSQMPFKDSYVFEFLDMPERYYEADLRHALMANMKNFILELGRDFTFVGQKYRIQVGGEEFFIDLLFFHRALNCLVAMELKIGPFKPSYVGQLNFYLEALDRDVRKDTEEPSIGILLCQGKNDQVVEYATSKSLSPTKISDYDTQLPDKKLMLEKLREFYDLANNSSEEE